MLQLHPENEVIKKQRERRDFFTMMAVSNSGFRSYHELFDLAYSENPGGVSSSLILSVYIKKTLIPEIASMMGVSNRVAISVIGTGIRRKRDMYKKRKEKELIK